MMIDGDITVTARAAAAKMGGGIVLNEMCDSKENDADGDDDKNDFDNQ